MDIYKSLIIGAERNIERKFKRDKSIAKLAKIIPENFNELENQFEGYSTNQIDLVYRLVAAGYKFKKARKIVDTTSSKEIIDFLCKTKDQMI